MKIDIRFGARLAQVFEGPFPVQIGQKNQKVIDLSKRILGKDDLFLKSFGIPGSPFPQRIRVFGSLSTEFGPIASRRSRNSKFGLSFGSVAFLNFRRILI